MPIFAAIRFHHNVLTLIDEPLTERSFEGWYMGFARLTEEDISGTQGFYDMFREPLHSVELKAKASAARSLLNTFRRHAR